MSQDKGKAVREKTSVSNVATSKQCRNIKTENYFNVMTLTEVSRAEKRSAVTSTEVSRAEKISVATSTQCRNTRKAMS